MVTILGRLMKVELSTEERINTASDAVVEAIRMSHRLESAGLYIPAIQHCYLGIVKMLPEIVELISPNEDYGFADSVEERTSDLPNKNEDIINQVLEDDESSTGNYM